MNGDQFKPEKIVNQPTINQEANDEEQTDGVEKLTDQEWDRVTELQGKNREDGTLRTREEAIAEVIKERK